MAPVLRIRHVLTRDSPGETIVPSGMVMSEIKTAASSSGTEQPGGGSSPDNAIIDSDNNPVIPGARLQSQLLYSPE